jgi:hypothetical protein
MITFVRPTSENGQLSPLNNNGEKDEYLTAKNILYGSQASNRKVAELMKKSNVAYNLSRLSDHANNKTASDLKKQKEPANPQPIVVAEFSHHSIAIDQLQQNVEPSYSKVLKNTRACFGFFSLVFGMMSWTKIDTTMEDKLRDDFNYSSELSALAYTIQFIAFLCVAPFCHKIMHVVDNTLLVSIS